MTGSIIVLILGVAATALRIYVGCGIPMFLVGDAAADDFLMVRYAETLMRGEWLGEFRGATLTKNAGYAVFMALLSKLNVPYVLGNTVFFCLCVLILCLAIFKLFPNKYVCFALYVYLLFSPVMLHTDAIQKTYRGGFLASVTLLLLASIIGLYGTILRRQHVLKTVLWSVCACISLVWFWFTKEDGIWLAPFVICGLGIASIVLFTGGNKPSNGKAGGRYGARRSPGYVIACSICLVMPAVSLLAASFAIRFINNQYYGEFAVTDRNDTYYSKVISDLYHIDDGEQSLIVWLSRDGLEKAFEVSPALAETKPYIDEMYKGSWAVSIDGQMHGDGIYWALREAVEANGLYEKGGAVVNEYYKKVHEELTAAFEDGRLPKDTESIYISSGGRGMTKKEIVAYFPSRIKKICMIMMRYSLNVTAALPAKGSEENIRRMAELVKSPYVPADGSNAGEFDGMVTFAVYDTLVYSKLGIAVTMAAAIGFLLYGIMMIVGFFRKDFERVPLMLVCVGMGLSIAVYVFAILWFIAWNTMELAYGYLGGVMLIINVLQVLGISMLVTEIVRVTGKIKDR